MTEGSHGITPHAPTHIGLLVISQYSTTTDTHLPELITASFFQQIIHVFLELQYKANAVVLFLIMMWPFPTIFFVLFAFTIILLQIVWIKTPMSSACGCRFVFTLWHTAPSGQQCDFPKSQFSVCRAIFVMRHCDWRSWYRTMRPWIGLVVIY